MSRDPARRPRVLVLSRNYPNSVMPRLGLWVQALARHLAEDCDVTVVAPTPYWPPLPGPADYARFGAVERERREGRVLVHHPRFLLGPGYFLHSAEAATYLLGVRGLCDRIRRERGFDLIHAHFGFPDGIVAAKLSRRYGVPAIVTEHAFHHPWLDTFPLVRRQTLSSQRALAAVVAVGSRVRDEIREFSPDLPVRVIPIGVDGDVFRPGAPRSAAQVLYVGHITYAKGVDVLLEAAALLARGRPEATFVLVGEGPYRHKRIQDEELRRRAADLGLGGRVRFTGGLPPEEVARWMRESTLLVLPSRRETFGAVLVEALASGIPVVATRCGGPEDIVTEETGALVPVGDAPALAAAIARTLDARARYDSAKLRQYALDRFSWRRVAAETVALYREVLSGGGGAVQPTGEAGARRAGAS